MRDRSSRAVGGVAIFAALTACSADLQTADGADIMVSVSAGAITAPAVTTAGWKRVHVREQRDEHIIVLFRLPDTSLVAAFLAALDTARSTPLHATALGGPEVGAEGDVVVQLTPGSYLYACVRRGADGKRHASHGEARLMHVSEGGAAAARAEPTAVDTVTMTDFAYLGDDRWSAGSSMLRVTNTGQQDHQLRLARLHDGSTLRDWVTSDDPGKHASDIAGVARLGPGQVAYLPLVLQRGEYVLYCLVPDQRTGTAHVELGMFRTVAVE